MRIGIEANEVMHGERAIRRYTVSLIQALARIKSDHEFRLLYFRFQKPKYEALTFSESGSRMNSSVVPLPGGVMFKLWERVPFPPVSWFLGPLDLFHAPGMFLPPSGTKPLVVTIHGMHPWRIGGEMDPEYRAWYELWMKRCLKRADCFITVSETMKQDMVQFLSVPPEKIRAIPLGVNDSFRSSNREKVPERLKKRFGLERPYILYVGGIQRHKNVRRILEAFAHVKKKYGGELSLVLVGDQPIGSEAILASIPKLGLLGDVIMPGYLEQESGDLELLYAGAKLFVFPTLWEGWSSPPLEAMASGVPVVASNIGPHQENLGDAAVLVNPASVEDLARAVGQFLE
ncbi:MAG: glycosyltransferase family 4 protein, partial [Candidatus Omnitrophica bacterium]|nr:glycosyltransferase family 4 protein [Candidatus Omnitrophota bacterium]